MVNDQHNKNMFIDRLDYYFFYYTSVKYTKYWAPNIYAFILAKLYFYSLYLSNK